MTSPAVPPYSSTTIAMWNFSVCISRSSSATLLRLGHEMGGPHTRPHRLAGLAGGAAGHEILQEDEADDVVVRVVVRREPRFAGFDRGRDRLVDGCIGFDRDHVGARHHDLAHDRVTEVEDRVDQLALFGLDRVLLRGDVGHRQDVGLGREGAHAHALAGQHDVGEADEPAGEDAQRREVGDGSEER